jgi:hypothetical protein
MSLFIKTSNLKQPETMGMLNGEMIDWGMLETIAFAATPLPALRKRVPIVSRIDVVLSPIEVGIRHVDRATERSMSKGGLCRCVAR